MAKYILRLSTRSRTSGLAPFCPAGPAAVEAPAPTTGLAAGSALITRLSLINIPPARGFVLGADRQQGRIFGALLEDVWAAHGKRAALGRMKHVRGQALDIRQAGVAGIDARQRAEQAAGVGMLGVAI